MVRVRGAARQSPARRRALACCPSTLRLQRGHLIYYILADLSCYLFRITYYMLLVTCYLLLVNYHFLGSYQIRSLASDQVSCII